MLNQLNLIGRLGKAPEVTLTRDNRGVVKFTVATESSYVKNGERKTETQWHNIELWGTERRLEAIKKYLTKGSLVHVVGMVKYKKVEETGQPTKYFTFIAADDVLFLDKRAGDTSGNDDGRDYDQVPD